MSFRAVITFHGIDEADGPLSFPSRLLDALLVALERAGLPIVDLDTLLDSAAGRGVAFTFDDGMRSVFAAAVPVLRDHGAPAHLFLATGSVAGTTGRVAMLDWAEIEQLHRAGVRIESHTHRHRDCRTLSDAEIDDECATADALIERHVGRRPRYFAYPFGRHDRRVRARIGRRYAAAFTTALAPLASDSERSRLPRLDAHYLRSPLWYARLDAPATRGYLLLRRALRLARGSE
ncbi:MAG TPA: polysaccharide deacetylase family protein [Casimicrobiaceae bacterium]